MTYFSIHRDIQSELLVKHYRIGNEFGDIVMYYQCGIHAVFEDWSHICGASNHPLRPYGAPKGIAGALTVGKSAFHIN